jgi:hypothetical protein
VQHIAQPNQPTVLYSGTVPADCYAKLLANITTIIQQHKQEGQEKQGRAVGSKGIQRTPAFIQAVLKDAVASVCAKAALTEAEDGAATGATVMLSGSELQLARGGTTDVGQHTGSSARDTSWPLVSHSIMVNNNI